MRRLLASSRYMLTIAVAGTFFLAVAMFVYGGILTVTVALKDALWEDVDAKGGKKLIVSSVEIIDIFLVATVLYLIALGLFSLFVDDGLPLPKWLKIKDLDDLKSKLVSVVIVALGVLFLGQVVTQAAETELLDLGISIAQVAGALTVFYALKTRHGDDTSHGDDEPEPDYPDRSP